MKINSFYSPLILLVPVSILLSGCISSGSETINERYQERTTVRNSWEPASSTSSLWGRQKQGGWKEIWSSLPVLHRGKRWLSRGENLLFVGYDRNSSRKTLVLITFSGSPAVDLSPEIYSNAIKKGLLEPRLTDGTTYMFDGLEENDRGLFVILKPGRGARNEDRVPTMLPIPAGLLQR